MISLIISEAEAAPTAEVRLCRARAVVDGNDERKGVGEVIGPINIHSNIVGVRSKVGNLLELVLCTIYAEGREEAHCEETKDSGKHDGRTPLAEKRMLTDAFADLVLHIPIR